MKALILLTLLVSAPPAAAMKVPCATAETGCERAVVVTVAGAEGDEDGKGKHQIKVITQIARDVDENRGWLGVALGEVHGEASEENGPDGGVTVLNVVKDSPADQAGLQENDILTHINGELIDGGVPALANSIGELGPGEVVNLTVIRDGRTLDLPATLGTPQQEFEWIQAPDLHFKDQLRWCRKGMKIMPGGGLQMVNLEDLMEGLEGSPGDLVNALGGLNAAISLSLDGGKRSLNIKTNKDGEIIEVAQEDNGPITVTRQTAGEDDRAEVEYATAEALEAADPEAFELYNRSQTRVMIHIPEIEIPDIDIPELDVDFDVKMGDWLTDDIHKQIEAHMQKARARMKDARNIIIDATSGIPQFSFGAVTRRFEVNPQGRIEMILRKGDTEVVKIFSDEADLEARDPDAFEHYKDVTDALLDE